MQRINAIPVEFSGSLDLLAKTTGLANFNEQAQSELASNKVIGYCEPGELCILLKPIFRKGKLGMLIWAAISRGKNGISKYLPVFLKIAKETHTEFIEFQSKRPGFCRLATKIDFTQAHSSNGFFVFRREV